MKIIYLANSLIPSKTANSIHVMKMCQAFSKEGHEVTLIVPDFNNIREQDFNSVYDFYKVEPCFNIVPCPFIGIKGMGLLHSFYAMVRIKSLNPDVVYGRDVISCSLAAMKGYRTFFESHSPIWEGSKVNYLFFKKMISQKSFKKLIVISKSLRHIYLEKGILSPDMIDVAHDGADEVDSFKEIYSCLGRKNTLQVGYVGHLYKGKGVEIVGAISTLLPQVDFHIIGGFSKDIEYWK